MPNKKPYQIYSGMKERQARAKSARNSVAVAEAEADGARPSNKPIEVNVKTIQAGVVEPYVFIIHTGSNNPDKEKIAKWEDGRMTFIINPNTERESPQCNVKELFSANREASVRVSRFLPAGIGYPVQLKIAVESNKLEIVKEALYIREITVIYRSEFFRFPVNDYLYPHNPLLMGPNDIYDGCPPYVTAKCGRGTFLSQETEPAILSARLDELQLRRKHLDWAPNTQEFILPGSTKEEDYDKLPRFLKFKNARQKAFQMNLKRGHTMMKKTVIENKIGVVFGKSSPEYFKSLEEFETFFIQQSEENKYDLGMVYDVLQVIRHWKSDEEFVRQHLAGINPARIYKITSLPATWDDMPTLPDHVLGPDVKFEEELAGGRMYFIDTNMLEVVEDGGMLMPILTGFELPMIVTLSDCLFYLDREDILRPIAIRIEYKNGQEAASFWFPPPDSAEEDTHEYLSWLLAKMYFNSANMQIHAILTHFVKSHAVVETFGIAMYRNLPRQHPLHKLLLPHLQGIIPINVQGRQFLTKAAGVMSALMSAGDRLWHLADVYMKQFHIDQLMLPKDIKKRQVEDIPDYHFRDDGMAWWENLRQYCQEFIELHYTSDELVSEDSELHNMLGELREFGYGRIPGNAGFPEKLETIPELIDFITMIMWGSSVWHTAVNFGQFNYLAFIPNSPCSMTATPPAQGDEITMERILQSLPVKEMARVQIDISYSLSLFSPVEKFYIKSVREEKEDLRTETTIVDEEELACMDRLTERLRVMQSKMEERNADLDIPYVIILPDMTPLTVQT